MLRLLNSVCHILSPAFAHSDETASSSQQRPQICARDPNNTNFSFHQMRCRGVNITAHMKISIRNSAATDDTNCHVLIPSRPCLILAFHDLVTFNTFFFSLSLFIRVRKWYSFVTVLQNFCVVLFHKVGSKCLRPH